MKFQSQAILVTLFIRLVDAWSCCRQIVEKMKKLPRFVCSRSYRQRAHARLPTSIGTLRLRSCRYAEPEVLPRQILLQLRFYGPSTTTRELSGASLSTWLFFFSIFSFLREKKSIAHKMFKWFADKRKD